MVGTRVRSVVYSRILTASQASGRSLSEELRAGLERAFPAKERSAT